EGGIGDAARDLVSLGVELHRPRGVDQQKDVVEGGIGIVLRARNGSDGRDAKEAPCCNENSMMPSHPCHLTASDTTWGRGPRPRRRAGSRFRPRVRRWGHTP